MLTLVEVHFSSLLGMAQNNIYLQCGVLTSHHFAIFATVSLTMKIEQINAKLRLILDVTYTIFGS